MAVGVYSPPQYKPRALAVLNVTSMETPPMTLIAAPRKRISAVQWRELKQIAQKVQRDLDTAGNFAMHDDYESVWEMWQCELEEETGVVEDDSALLQPSEWYTSAKAYWDDAKNCPTTDNGVLGGFAHVSPADIHDSKLFLDHVASIRPQWTRGTAVDCGAGIGRVVKSLLVPQFDRVDILEQSERLLRSVPQYMDNDTQTLAKIRHLYCMGMQDFEPEDESYDLIWLQWVSPHLTDVDFVHFLQRCRRALKPHGWIGIKENMLMHNQPYDLDMEDRSITRSEVYYKSIFAQAGLTIITEKTQQNFPEELYPVKMFALGN